MDAMLSPLAAWNSFYVIIGSSAAALTGLMFVVISLIPDSGVKTSGDTISAYGTPTVVHFCAALLISAVLCAPWSAIDQVGWAIGAIGGAGVIYVGIVLRRARAQTEYQAVAADWIWHTILPAGGYASLIATAIMVAIHPARALFIAGGATILLLFIGIHNAWDTVTFLAIDRLRLEKNERSAPDPDNGMGRPGD
jgi:hypothetical protein